MVCGGHRQLEHLEQSRLGGTAATGPGPRELQTEHLTHTGQANRMHCQGSRWESQTRGYSNTYFRDILFS